MVLWICHVHTDTYFYSTSLKSERGSSKDKHLCKKEPTGLGILGMVVAVMCGCNLYLLKYPFLSFNFFGILVFPFHSLFFVCSSFFNSFSVRKWCNPVYYCLRESNGIAFVTILAAVLWRWRWWWCWWLHVLHSKNWL